ncbi:hypothetical protein NKH77_16960 [Streptomyces sp. M19]
MRAIRREVREPVLRGVMPESLPLDDLAMTAIAEESDLYHVFSREERREYKSVLKEYGQCFDERIPGLRHALRTSIQVLRPSGGGWGSDTGPSGVPALRGVLARGVPALLGVPVLRGVMMTQNLVLIAQNDVPAADLGRTPSLASFFHGMGGTGGMGGTLGTSVLGAVLAHRVASERAADRSPGGVSRTSPFWPRP